MGAAPYILVLGQDCAARYQLLNCLLGERLLPLGPEAGEACEGVQGTVCKRRKLCFTHGRQTRLSLALPGQYELVHQLAANCGRWDTVPREDLEIHEECEDPAHRLAELEITLHHPLLQVGFKSQYSLSTESTHSLNKVYMKLNHLHGSEPYWHYFVPSS